MWIISELSGLKRHKLDVVIPLHNASDDFSRCIQSLKRQAFVDLQKIVVVDDASDGSTRKVLDREARDWRKITIVRQDRRCGFTHSANVGLLEAESETIVLLNSDTVPASNALAALASKISSDAQFAAVGPLSNAGGFQSIPRNRKNFLERLVRKSVTNPMPSTERLEIIGTELAANPPREITPVPFLNGFCLALRKTALEQVGLFDTSHFPDGYGEEIDLMIRFKLEGWQLGLATNSFVAHRGSSSYGHFRRLMLTSRGVNQLKKKHGKEFIQRLFLESDTFSLGVTSGWTRLQVS